MAIWQYRGVSFAIVSGVNLMYLHVLAYACTYLEHNMLTDEAGVCILQHHVVTLLNLFVGYV